MTRSNTPQTSLSENERYVLGEPSLALAARSPVWNVSARDDTSCLEASHSSLPSACWHLFGGRGEVLKPDGGPVVTVMDFRQSFPLDPLPPGWKHQKFWTRSPMTMSFAVKDGVPSMRFETHDSGSMLFRHVDIDLAAYPMLAWRWYIELPIRSPIDERTREGDDHPARLFLRFATDRGEKRAMEVIWGNRLKPGEYKYIGGFPHFVADAGENRVSRWLDEKIDLGRVYGEIWKDAAPAHLVDVAVFCDSDDTHTASISYFDYVRLERR